MQFWIEGGWVMWPTTVFGLVLLGAAGHFAWSAEMLRLRFIVAMSALMSVTIAHGTLTDVGAVFQYLSTREIPEGQFGIILCQGLMESTRPAGLGGAFMVLALVLTAVGVHRATQRELRAR